MAVNKRYVANNRQSLMIIINHPGLGQTTIEFKPGYGLRSEGYFLTNDPEMQDALESDKRYEKSYRLAEIDNMDIAEYTARKIIAEREKEESKELPKENPAEETEQDNTPKKRSFETSQAAKDWLNKEHNVPFNQISNRKKIVDKATELGFNIEFLNDNNY